MRRVVVVCPGRGSYSRETRGSVRPGPSVAAADAFRAALGRPTPTEMDTAETYSSRLHVAGENASLLTMAASLSDRDALREVDVDDPNLITAVARAARAVGVRLPSPEFG